jgi:hypothetical protein
VQSGNSRSRRGAVGEVDNDGPQVEDSGGVLQVRDKVAACFKAGDEAATCTGAGIEDDRQQRHQ